MLTLSIIREYLRVRKNRKRTEKFYTYTQNGFADRDWINAKIKHYVPQQPTIEESAAWWKIMQTWLSKYAAEDAAEQRVWMEYVFQQWINHQKGSKGPNRSKIRAHNICIMQGFEKVFTTPSILPYRSQWSHRDMQTYMDMQSSMTWIHHVQGEIPASQLLRMGCVRARDYQEHPEWFNDWKNWIQRHHINVDIIYTQPPGMRLDHVVVRECNAAEKEINNPQVPVPLDIDLEATAYPLLLGEKIPPYLHIAVCYWLCVQIEYRIQSALDPDPFSGETTVYPENILIHTPNHAQYPPFVRAMLVHWFRPYLQKDLTIDPIFELVDYHAYKKKEDMLSYARRLEMLAHGNALEIDPLEL